MNGKKIEKALGKIKEAIDEACESLTLEEYGEVLDETACYLEACQEARLDDLRRED